jgi:hypothetical protein
MTVGEMEDRMSEYELAMWKGLASVEAAEREHADKVARSRRQTPRRR